MHGREEEELNMAHGSRSFGRGPRDLRPVRIDTGFIEYPEGSALIEMGKTHVLCNVTVEEGVPTWMENHPAEGGWLTAEYAMLPRSTQRRTPREVGRPRARSQEIRRLIGRSLRAALDLSLLGRRTCIVDCDVLQADGGTRTAAITGGYVALRLALEKLIRAGEIPQAVLRPPVAAVSVGIIAGECLVDLDYAEDAQADVDINIVMNASGEMIELQGTAEGALYGWDHWQSSIAPAEHAIRALFEMQQRALAPGQSD